MVAIHPSVDRIIRLAQIRLIRLGHDYDYSAALNGLIVGGMFLAIAKGSPDPENVKHITQFLSKMESEEIPEETLRLFEEYMRKLDQMRETD
jgi:hypothetical protein